MATKKKTNATTKNLRNMAKTARKVPMERIPWCEMRIGNIYVNKRTGKHFIFAGRANVVYNASPRVTAAAADPESYVYIYLDYPNVLVKNRASDTIELIASSARIRASEYRDIACECVGTIPNYANQKVWKVADFTIYTHTDVELMGSKKYRVDFTQEQQASFTNFMKKGRKATRKLPSVMKG